MRMIMTDAGGITHASLRALGLPTKNNKGWFRKMLGKTISEESFNEAVKGRGVTIQKRNKETIHGSF